MQLLPSGNCPGGAAGGPGAGLLEEQMTPELCAAFCAGFRYFGTQASGQQLVRRPPGHLIILHCHPLLQASDNCWCGDAYGSQGEADASACSSHCKA